MTIYGVEEYGGLWEDSWSRIKIAFPTIDLAEKYALKARARARELCDRIADCESCIIFFNNTDDRGVLTTPFDEAKAICHRAEIDFDGHLVCMEKTWRSDVPNYNVIPIELIDDEKVIS